MLTLINKYLPSSIIDLFECTQIAEKEIAAAVRLHPDQAAELEAAFLLLQPPPALKGLMSDLYHVHCREILEALSTKKQPPRRTKAEVMASLCHASQARPLHRDAVALYTRLFVELMPKAATRVNISADEMPESWPGACDELLARLMRSKVS